MTWQEDMLAHPDHSITVEEFISAQCANSVRDLMDESDKLVSDFRKDAGEAVRALRAQYLQE